MSRFMDNVPRVWRVRLEHSTVPGGRNSWRFPGGGDYVSFRGPYASRGAARAIGTKLEREAREDNVRNRSIPDGPGWVEVKVTVEFCEAFWKPDDEGDDE